ncbi:hypothetical protein ARMGADRAFT_778818 [Armillaria gallica]|uniref:Uncharacterized protein n=1 Tax=Armillaria gallica TaxID=47427 RepID=A0A2H3CEJ0_ARMGA|nr:hypothetical protein ARMGADRAFT_778818 [Armillaria gallica]
MYSPCPWLTTIYRTKGEGHHAESRRKVTERQRDSEVNVPFVLPSSVLRPSFAPDISMEANSKPAWLTGWRICSLGGRRVSEVRIRWVWPWEGTGLSTCLREHPANRLGYGTRGGGKTYRHPAAVRARKMNLFTHICRLRNIFPSLTHEIFPERC